VRENEWTGGEESYSIAEKDDITNLTATFDVSPAMKEYLRSTAPKPWSDLMYI
jgi:hypothetical protein